MSENTGGERRSNDQLLAVVATRLDALHSDLRELKSTQKEMVAAFTRLVVIEERQSATAAAQERAFLALTKFEANLREVEGRVDALEREAPLQKQASKWIVAAVLGAAVLFVTLAAKKLSML